MYEYLTLFLIKAYYKNLFYAALQKKCSWFNLIIVLLMAIIENCIAMILRRLKQIKLCWKCVEARSENVLSFFLSAAVEENNIP